MWNIRDFSVFASRPQLKILSFLLGRGRQSSWGKPKTLPVNELTKPEVFTQELVHTRASAGNLTETRKRIGVPLSLGVELTHKRIRRTYLMARRSGAQPRFSGEWGEGRGVGVRADILEVGLGQPHEMRVRITEREVQWPAFY